MGAVRKAFGRNLAYHRERLGWTQARLAEAIGSSPSYIGHLERGERDPSLLTIEEISKALRIDAGELLVARDVSDARAKAAAELAELLRARNADDIAMAVRLLRAALEHPRLREGTAVAAGTSPDGRKLGARRQRRRAGRRRIQP